MTDFTPVADNSFVPFGTTLVPRGDDNSEGPFDISAIFEDGLRLGPQTYSQLYIATNGLVSFGSRFSWTNTFTPLPMISVIIGDLDARTPAPDTPTSGVWFDLNTERDSVVVTWNAVGFFPNRTDITATIQLELLDLGGGDFEAIYRYAEVGTGVFDARVGINDGQGLFTPLLPGIEIYSDPETGSAITTQPGNTNIAGVFQVRVEGGVVQPLGEPTTITGTAQDDNLVADIYGSTLFGLDGNDTLFGGPSDDFLYGGAGDDLLFGGRGGRAELWGEDGNDTIEGGPSLAVIDGGAGDDLLTAARGNSTIRGGDGDDVIVLSNTTFGSSPGSHRVFAGAGNDLISADTSRYWSTTGNHFLNGMDGDDTISGGMGNDTIGGQTGNDVINGGYGDDRIFGGDGDDFLWGGASGRDVLTGGAGADRFYHSGDFIWGGSHPTIITDYNPDEGDWIVYGASGAAYNELQLRVTRILLPDGTDTGQTVALFSTRLDREVFVFANGDQIDRIHVRLPGQDLGLGLPFEILFDLG